MFNLNLMINRLKKNIYVVIRLSEVEKIVVELKETDKRLEGQYRLCIMRRYKGFGSTIHLCSL